MARPFTVIGFTLFFALALIFEAGQKAAIVLISAAVAAFVFSIFFKSARRDFVVPVAAVTVIIAVLLSFSAGLVPAEASELYADGVHSVRASVVSLEEQKYGRFYTQIKTSEIDGEPYEINLRLSSKESLDAEPYDIVEGSFQLYDLGQTEDARNYYLSENVFMGCYSKGEISVSKPDKRPLGYYPLAMRAKIKISLSAGISIVSLSPTTACCPDTRPRFQYVQSFALPTKKPRRSTARLLTQLQRQFPDIIPLITMLDFEELCVGTTDSVLVRLIHAVCKEGYTKV